MVLDLLRLATGPLPVAGLCAAGATLGIPHGTIRVTLTRLLAAEKIQRDDRGRYRLAPAADSFSHFLDAWREGDSRTRAWQGDWLCVWYPRGTERLERARSIRSLEMLGLREALEGIWVRPNNLAAALPALRVQLFDFGLSGEANVFVASDFADVEAWYGLWPLVELEAKYQRSRRELKRSGPRLARLPVGRGAAEVYRVTGVAIRTLAFDPLLPDEILPGESRRALRHELLAYDKKGRAVWNQLIDVARESARASDHR